MVRCLYAFKKNTSHSSLHILYIQCDPNSICEDNLSLQIVNGTLVEFDTRILWSLSVFNTRSNKRQTTLLQSVHSAVILHILPLEKTLSVISQKSYMKQIWMLQDMLQLGKVLAISRLWLEPSLPIHIWESTGQF